MLHSSTMEFGICRGTQKYNAFLATLQMVDRICDVALFLPDEEIESHFSPPCLSSTGRSGNSM